MRLCAVEWSVLQIFLFRLYPPYIAPDEILSAALAFCCLRVEGVALLAVAAAVPRAVAGHGCSLR